MGNIQGFFSDSSDSKDNERKSSIPLMSGTDCKKCKLYKTCKSPRMKMTGEGRKGIFFLAEAPGKDEDECNKQLVGDAGKLLRKVLRKFNIDLDRDCYKINCVNCFVSPSTLVYTSEGCKRITDVNIGDLVLTHKGRFKKVLSRIHDLPLEKRKNKEFLVDVVCKDVNSKYKSEKKFKLTVTENHSFLRNKKWVKAIDLSIGDSLTALGSKCEVCGNIYFKGLKNFDSRENTCSQKCHNILSAKKSGKAISKSMCEQYKNGIRNNKTSAKKAQKVAKEKESWKEMISIKNRKKSNKTKAKNRQGLNSLSDSTMIIGKGEKELSKHLLQNKIEFVHQFAIGRKNFDFYLPKYNLIVEIDGDYKNKQKHCIIEMEKRNKLLKKKGYDFIRISSNKVVSSFKRIFKNHNKEYVFTELKVVEKVIRCQKRQEYLYCLEVEDDHSFIAKNGLVHHNCRPPGNREPTDKEIKCCRPMVDEALLKTKPKLIILLGNKALQNFYSGMVSKRHLTISNWTNHCIPDIRYNTLVVPCFHPSALLHNQDEVLEAIFEKDIGFALSCLDRELPKYKDPKNTIAVLKDCDKVIDAIREVRKTKRLFVDYETSGLKPFIEGHKIYTMSIAGKGTKVYSFPYQYVYWKPEEFKRIRHEFRKLMEDDEVEKIAQGINFERKWTHSIIGVKTTNWVWCTMTAQHIIDVRKHMTRIEVQALINYGEKDWEGEIGAYKKSVDAYGFNKMHKAPLDKLLLYNGYDVFYTRRRFYGQRKQILEDKDLSRCWNEVFYPGLLALGEAEETGIRVNVKYFRRKTKELETDLKEQMELLQNRGAGLKFKNKFGRKIDIQSPKDLRLLFFNILKLKPLKKTSKDFDAVDAYTLSNINVPYSKAIMKYRKTKKMYDYINEYDKSNDGERIHPSIELHLPASGRSSSSSPNLQNVPVRNEEARNMIRGGILPSKGNQILEADYKAIEVRIMACYSKDPVLISYIMDETKDMHRDMAMKIFKLPKEEITKELRHIGKNDFVFPQFYGDYYVPCAKSAWEDSSELKTKSGIPIMKHLRKVGIGTFESFTENMKKVESDFWRMLKVTKKWRDKVVEEYKKKGHVDTFFGFRRGGYMVKNQITNTPVQGTAFHCLMWSYWHIKDELKKRNLKSKLIGEIHDSLLIDMLPSEREIVVKIVNRIMTKDIINEHKKWLVVPLEVEIEATPIDGAWNTKEPLKMAA